MQTSIALIGAGNMGSALISGLIAQHYPPKKLWVSDPSAEKLASLHQKFGVSITPQNEEALRNAETLIFAVKPQTLETVAKELAAAIQHTKPLVLSVAAGIREARIQEWLGGNLAI